MYATHARRIQAWANENPDNLARVIQLAIVSAHAPFHRLVTDMRIAEDPNEALAVLFGWKARAYHEAWETRETIAEACAGAMDAATPREAADNVLGVLARQHGLGFAKAGFVAQMAYGVSGCLDTHNLQRWGIKPYLIRSRIKERPMTEAGYLTRVAMYNEVVYSHGGPETLWDSWCKYVAIRYPNRYKNAYHVSSLHCEALGLES